MVGCGRNGTSLTAGLFRSSGLFMGDHLHGPTEQNPLGYFEDAGINMLNNHILAACVPTQRIRHHGVEYAADVPGLRHRWLARVAVDVEIGATPDQQASIDEWVSRRPFCYKDTRFCYLLHLWRRNAGPVRMVCVFRSPAAAVRSILHSAHTRPVLADLAIGVNQAFEVWTLMYSHVLRRHAQMGDWFFVDYDDILSGRALGALERFSGRAIDRSFPDAALNRSRPDLEVPDAAALVWAELRRNASECYAAQ